jgi:hypothetical protein
MHFSNGDKVSTSTGRVKPIITIVESVTNIKYNPRACLYLYETFVGSAIFNNCTQNAGHVIFCAQAVLKLYVQ